MKLIAWDFDGVLNRGFQGGFQAWQRDFETEIGASAADFTRHVWEEGRFLPVASGHRDLIDLLEEWRSLHGVAAPARAVLDWWLRKDALPDAEVLDWVARAPVPGVIATNNEARRGAFIWNDMGFSARFAKLFASGEMGVRKPDPAFFARIEAWSGHAPGDHLLVDDSDKNIEAALARGWQAFHFTDATRAGLPATLGIAA